MKVRQHGHADLAHHFRLREFGDGTPDHEKSTVLALQTHRDFTHDGEFIGKTGACSWIREDGLA